MEKEAMNMAVPEYRWQDCKQEDMEKFCRWCQNVLNLRDWEITFDYGSKKPKELHGKAIAGAHVWSDLDKAMIWLPLERMEKNDENPYDSLAHELLHVLTLKHRFSTDDSEMISYRLSPILYELYCHKHGLTMAEKRD
jgi:hypothetical protein